MSALVSANLANLNDICEAICARISGKTHAIFLLIGDIGAGKTTLVQNFAKFIGIDESVTSPTFSLLHIYGDSQNQQKNAHDSSLRGVKNAEAIHESSNKNGLPQPAIAGFAMTEKVIYHYDLYNASLEHALDLGLLDLLETDGIHFVEWGDLRLFEILKNAFENICVIAISKTKNARIYAFKEQI
ncbi:tRNA (adenosine(37)-N6)-threonylcarbamoyltransferase complex ATPase subunit type 1 TsaE [Helicobacter sp. 23-1045]